VFSVQCSVLIAQCSVFRVQGSGFRVQGLGFTIQGSGFRVGEQSCPAIACPRYFQERNEKFRVGECRGLTIFLGVGLLRHALASNASRILG